MLSSTIIKALEKELRDLRSQKEWIDKRVDAITVLLEDSNAGLESSYVVPRGGRMKMIADAAFAFLEDFGRPARRESILSHLLANGVEVRGKDRKVQLMTVSSALSKDPRFKSMGRSSGLWIIERQHADRIEKLDDALRISQPPIAQSGIATAGYRPHVSRNG